MKTITSISLCVLMSTLTSYGSIGNQLIYQDGHDEYAAFDRIELKTLSKPEKAIVDSVLADKGEPVIGNLPAKSSFVMKSPASPLGKSLETEELGVEFAPLKDEGFLELTAKVNLEKSNQRDIMPTLKDEESKVTEVPSKKSFYVGWVRNSSFCKNKWQFKKKDPGAPGGRFYDYYMKGRGSGKWGVGINMIVQEPVPIKAGVTFNMKVSLGFNGSYQHSIYDLWSEIYFTNGRSRWGQQRHPIFIPRNMGGHRVYDVSWNASARASCEFKVGVGFYASPIKQTRRLSKSILGKQVVDAELEAVSMGGLKLVKNLWMGTGNKQIDSRYGWGSLYNRFGGDLSGGGFAEVGAKFKVNKPWKYEFQVKAEKYSGMNWSFSALKNEISDDDWFCHGTNKGKYRLTVGRTSYTLFTQVQATFKIAKFEFKPSWGIESRPVTLYHGRSRSRYAHAWEYSRVDAKL